MKKGPAGTRSLNTALQALLNPPAPDKQQVQRRGMEATAVFRVGDRVIQVITQLLAETPQVSDISRSFCCASV
jgi:ATP-dependent exoDNAse (exonuclease V) alpha subunit